MSVFSALALFLAVFGVFSVITQAVVQRRFEMAIRSAVGAAPRQLVAMTMRTAVQPTVIGVAIGIFGSADYQPAHEIIGLWHYLIGLDHVGRSLRGRDLRLCGRGVPAGQTCGAG